MLEDVARMGAEKGAEIAIEKLLSTNLANYKDTAQMPLPENGGTVVAQYRQRICIGHNDDGSPVFKRISANSHEELADKAVRAILNSERRCEFVADAPAHTKAEEKDVPTFKEYAEHWLELYKEPTLKETSIGSYEHSLSKLYPTFADTPLDQITTDALQVSLNELAAQGIVKSTIDKIMITVKQVLQSAKEDQLITLNVADTKRLKNPSTVVYKREALTNDEYYDIIRNLPKLQAEDRALMALFLFTGIRKGEALGLKWQNVDFDKGVIHIRDNATYPNGTNEAVLTTPKSKASERTLSITEPLKGILLALEQKGTFVIGGQDKPITKSSFTKRMARIKKTINIYGATPHIFRHTYGTFLAYQGVSAIDLKQIMGHEDISTTLKTYVHPQADMVRDAEYRAANALVEAVKAVA